MTDIFLISSNLPFTIAILVALLIGLVELFSLMIGSGGLVDGLTADFDPSVDVDGFSILDYLCIGKIPFLMWLVVMLLSFGGIGIIFQSIFDLNIWLASVIVLVLAVFPTRIISLFLSKVLPKDETTAIYSIDFIGYKATIVLGESRVGYPAQAKFKDLHNQTHYVMVEPLSDEDTYKAGDVVSLYEKSGDIFKVVKN